MVRPAELSISPGRIGGDRCVGLLTRAVAASAASQIEPSGRPVSVLLFPFAVHSVGGRGLVGRWFMGGRGGRCREFRA